MSKKEKNQKTVKVGKSFFGFELSSEIREKLAASDSTILLTRSDAELSLWAVGNLNVKSGIGLSMLITTQMSTISTQENVEPVSPITLPVLVWEYIYEVLMNSSLTLNQASSLMAEISKAMNSLVTDLSTPAEISEDASPNIDTPSNEAPQVGAPKAKAVKKTRKVKEAPEPKKADTPKVAAVVTPSGEALIASWPFPGDAPQTKVKKSPVKKTVKRLPIKED